MIEAYYEKKNLLITEYMSHGESLPPHTQNKRTWHIIADDVAEKYHRINCLELFLKGEVGCVALPDDQTQTFIYTKTSLILQYVLECLDLI